MTHDGIYQTLEEAIESANHFAESFDDELYLRKDLVNVVQKGWVRITSVDGGGYEIFGTGDLVMVI